MRRLVIKLVALALLTVFLLLTTFKVGQWQRQSLVAELDQRIRAGNAAEAMAAIKQLPNLNEDAVDTLLATAVQPRPRLAPAARWAVEDLLNTWHNESTPQDNRLAKRLHRLSKTMSAQVDTTQPEAQLWLGELAGKVLESIDRVPAGKAVVITSYCDYVVRAARTAEQQLLLAAQTVKEIEQPSIDSRVPDSVQEPLRIASRFDSNVLPPDNAKPSEPHHQVRPSMEWSGDGSTDSRLDLSELSQQQPFHATETENGAGSNLQFVGPTTARTSPNDENDQNELREEFRRRASDGHQPNDFPMLKGHDVESRVVREVDSGGVSAQSPKGPTEPTNGKLPLAYRSQLIREIANLEGIALLERWVESPTVERPLVEQELNYRGLSKIPLRLAQQLSSANTQIRIQGIENLFRVPSVKPGPWLELMADDPSTDVRFVVVSLLSTSSDQDLLEKAWQIAVHDRDPRIAGLAQKIQDVRDGKLRR